MNRIYTLIIFFSLASLSGVAKVYQVSSDADWAQIQLMASNGYDFTGDIINLQKDVKTGGKIARFNGVLKGNNHTITAGGLVDELLADGEICDLTVYYPANLRSESKSPIGGIVNVCSGLINNCTSKVQIYQVVEDYYVIAGGIAGEVLPSGRVVFCRNEAAVTGSVTDIERVYFPRVGGVVGWNKGLVAASTNTGVIKATTYCTLMLGGVVGHSDGSTSIVEGCTNHGRVQGNITRTETSAYINGRVGGVVGYAQNSQIIAECLNSGYITTNVDHVGGVLGVGASTSLVNCANSGEVLNQQSFYYSCAGGICSLFGGKSTAESVFLNCVNTGKVRALTGLQFIATAGGVCPNLENCSYGNTLNFGAVSAEGKDEFVIQNVAQDRCEVINIAKNIDEANNYVRTSHSDASLPWLLEFKGSDISTTLSGEMLQATISYPGMVESFFDGTLARTATVALTIDGKILHNAAINNNYVSFSNLTPNADCLVEWLDNAGNVLFRKHRRTKELKFTTTVSDICSTSASVITECNMKGLTIISLSYTFGNGIGLLESIDADSRFSASLTGLAENTSHFVMPVIRLSSGQDINGSPVNFTTLRLQPRYEKIEVGTDWVKLKLLNREELKHGGINEFGPSSYFMDNGEPTLYYMQNDDDEILLPDLKTRTQSDVNRYQRIGTFIYRNGKKEIGEEIMKISLPFNAMDPIPLYVSPTSAMVRGVCPAFYLYPSRLNILHIADEEIQEYESATQILTQSCYAVFPYVLGDTYYVALEAAKNDYSWYNSTISPRIEVDLSQINCTQVPPYILMPQVSKDRKYLTGKYVKGEGDWTFYWEYKASDADKWIRRTITGTSVPQYLCNDIPQGEIYYIRFSAENGSIKLSSRTVAAQSDGYLYYLGPTADEQLSTKIDKMVVDTSELDDITRFYDIKGAFLTAGVAENIIPTLKPGFYILRNGSFARKLFIK
ncbi:MAG: hypothetical protein J6C05_01295 [Prevotella sp.]|nr:hypothetical protein [Prevotella sp.]